jgi:hypothetical protein
MNPLKFRALALLLMIPARAVAAEQPWRFAGDFVLGAKVIAAGLANEAESFGHDVLIGSKVISNGAGVLAQDFIGGSKIIANVTATGASLLAEDFTVVAGAAWDAMPDRYWWRDAGISAAAVGTTAGAATYVCAVGGGIILGPVGAGAGGLVCSIFGQIGGRRLVRYGYQRFETPLSGDALDVGGLIGGLAGSMAGVVGATITLREIALNQFANYGGYAKEARRLTELNARPYAADLAQYRQRSFDLDHIIPIKCGWLWGLPAAELAKVGNLQLLPAYANRALGAKGC